MVEGEFIVVMKRRAEISATQEVRRTAVRGGGEILFDYSAALDGFAARLPEQALQAVKNNPDVAFVETNRTVTAFGEDQYDPPWGLDRIDQRGRNLNRTYHYDQTGAGVKAYVIDTGIRITHAQFGNRASHGFTSIFDGNGADDCNGHGTHVAGTIGGKKHGVAKSVKLVAVRVLDCDGNGTFAGVIEGIDFVTGAHQTGEPAVANMSLGGGFTSSVNLAVSNSIADGITYVLAAGNDNANACNVSPASTPEALTVGATTYEDRRASYSNWGTCLDLFAPGSQVLSAYRSSDTSSHIFNGTSQATPHVAGVVATYLQADGAATPAEVAAAVLGAATDGKVRDPAGSPNKLLFSKVGPTSPSSPPPASTNLVAQAGFESGLGIWRGTEWTINCSEGAPTPRTGSCNGWLGGYGTTKTTTLGQSGIELPAAPVQLLRFYVKVQTEEPPGQISDKLNVRVIANGTATTVLTLSNEDGDLPGSAGYVRYTVPLAAQAGQTIEIRFTANEDAGAWTSFFVDDVTVK